MTLIGDSPSNKERQAWLAIFLSHSVLAAAMLKPTMEKLSKADTQQSRSRSSSIREEPSHQASLMAGISFLGPSDVPCLVETSTAHGDLLFSATFSSIEMVKLSGSISYISNLVQDPQSSPLPSPQLTEPPEPTTPFGRRLAQICLLPTKEKLGFSLVDSSKLGPTTLLKPKPKRYNPVQILSKPRSVLIAALSIFSRMCSSWEKIDKRHRFTRNSSLLPWMSKESMRTLPLDSPSSISYESKRLKKKDIRLGAYPLKQFEIVPIQWSQPEVVLSSLFSLQPSRTSFNYSENTLGIKSRTELLPDLKGLRRPSSSIVERTSAPPSFFMERNRSNLLVAAGLASARHEAKNPFLTPQNLLIMAIYEIPESFVEVSLTHPSLACDMLLVSLCFRDSRDLSFKLFVCLIHLLYVCKIMLQNFVSYVPLFEFD